VEQAAEVFRVNDIIFLPPQYKKTKKDTSWSRYGGVFCATIAA